MNKESASVNDADNATNAPAIPTLSDETAALSAAETDRQQTPGVQPESLVESATPPTENQGNATTPAQVNETPSLNAKVLYKLQWEIVTLPSKQRGSGFVLAFVYS